MVLSESEKLRIQNEKDNLLKESLKQEYLQAQKEMKALNSQIREEKKQHKINTATTDQSGKPCSYWDKVKINANQLVEKDFAGYNDWAIGMMGLVHALMDLNKAIAKEDVIWKVVTKNPVVNNPLTHKLWERTGGIVSDALTKKLLKDGKLPDVKFYVEINKAKGLVTTISKNNKPLGNDEVSQKLQESFDTGIIAWAKLHGYEAIATPGVPPKKDKLELVDKAGNKMTQGDFNALNEDPDHGLEAFLSNRFNMAVKSAAPAA
ncbi:hypothetical protein [Legionella fairfieldensis]|uniref:hypothetical protein n=1 Tax=Legionella fairfieldensis TaxID=45064 RepID=UPI00048D7258|nr:hypothetical protein [Legionella fairfieldensis]